MQNKKDKKPNRKSGQKSDREVNIAFSCKVDGVLYVDHPGLFSPTNFKESPVHHLAGKTIVGYDKQAFNLFF